MPTAVKFIQATMVLTAINEHTVNTKTGKSTHVRDFSRVEISFFFGSEFACSFEWCDFRANQRAGLKCHVESIQ
jgi:hypothetical protein